MGQPKISLIQIQKVKTKTQESWEEQSRNHESQSEWSEFESKGELQEKVLLRAGT